MKNWFGALAGAFFVMLGGAAHAAVVTYDFTATIDLSNATDLGLTTDSTVSGSFSYDTEVPAGGGSTPDSAGYATGYVTTTVAGPGLSGEHFTSVARNGSGYTRYILKDYFSQATVGSTTVDVDPAYSFQEIRLDGYSPSAGLPAAGSLSLSALSSAQYTFFAGNGTSSVGAIGRLTSLTARTAGDPAAVPELSASGVTGASGLLIGGALILHARRRDGDSA